MDISLSLDSLQSASRFPCSFKTHENSFFRRRKHNKNTLISIKGCVSELEHGLKQRPSRPVPKPLKTEKKPELGIPQKGDFGMEVCGQIEKLVLRKGYDEALELLEILECKSGGILGDSTFDALVSACIGLKSIRGVKRVFRYMMESGFDPDLYMMNRVLLMHVKCGMMIDARTLFDEMPERNLVSWHTMMGALVDSGDYLEAFRLFKGMWRENLDVSSRTLVLMINASAGMELILPGKQLHCFAVKLGLYGDVFVSCALIDMYSKCGSIGDARFVFDEMREKTTVGWNTIIAGYAFHGYSEEALSLYYEMQDAGVKMDHFTFSTIMRVCIRLASLVQGKQAHAALVRRGFGLDVVASTSLVDFYSKWGRIEDAQNVFDKMSRKNVVSWNALIAGYGNHGRGAEAVQLFGQMVSDGMVPNHVTFLAVLKACSYSGLSEKGWEIFTSMIRDNNVKPRAMHYACMIELLGREELLDEALALMRDAPFRPTVNMWAALLVACRVHKNLVLGKFAAERLYEMLPENRSNYMTLLNIYISSGKLIEVAAIVGTLKKKGLQLLPACTWIEIKNQSCVFISGDKRHVQTKEIYEKLDQLTTDISKHGYVPGTKTLLPDVDEHEEKLQHHHSEKLAVCFGLINTLPSTPLQLVQSHRICNDCHSWIKVVSKVTEREMTARDGSRFHRFIDGKCSCGDYW